MSTDARKRIALSFDDVPRAAGAFFTPAERTERLIAALAEGGVAQAVFYVTTGHLDAPFGEGGEARIAAYVAAGHVIANHSHGHPALSRTDADAYLADIDRAEAWLKERPGHRPWYRFTYLDEGAADPARRDAVRAGLAARGLINGYITADSYDWFLDDLAGAATRAGRTLDMQGLADVHAGLIVRAAAFADRLARETIGRAPAQMLLLHECDVTAAALAHSVAYLRANDWEIVTADEAYADPIAAEVPDAPFLAGGRVAALASAAGRSQRSLVPELNNEAAIARLFEQRVLRAEARA
jgi:peptidoglycan-N-acetylglucosamine deacetylase